MQFFQASPIRVAISRMSDCVIEGNMVPSSECYAEIADVVLAPD